MATETVVRPKAKVRIGDRVFSISTVAAGSLILLVLAAVAIFLIAQSIPAFTATPDQLPGEATSFWAYVGPLVFGTIWSAVIALVIALPLSIGIALFISHYAPRRIAMALGYIVDLLAAVPSVVFGLWGATVLAPMVQPFYLFLNVNIGWFPLFGGQASGTGKTILTASVVLAVMVIPIITAVCREIFLQAPRLHEEAALALGATRWEMIRMAVLPFGAPGIVSAAMLGLGRALGETLAVAMVLSPATVVSFLLLTSQNSNTIAANIALQFPEASGVGVNVLVASGLILFVITLVVNSIARFIVNRRKAFSGAN
ncbi:MULTISPECIES: phosphate ABC transporter permease subunit PstC [unclassified Rathayibacter]|uniref:phosphate ABC transporter permease subunit PstC n=1 Tax=unclassified Rathayibacter TaxID=2609250 RepID=UPI0006FC2451|nr:MULTISPECIES: phosphate ABC transporter permease subunit PstC [unclassified Rathayibacter]KQQ05132.1 phosphate ABC transporter permease [Rathayibacter sp. Leaf294]KQS12995.1 phosphate ABC transporter permease [Rathayibacter sp. Leaf185]